MLTIPNEIVPLQIARGVLLVLSLPRSRGRVGVGARLRAVLGAIPNIKGISTGWPSQLGRGGPLLAVLVGLLLWGDRLHAAALFGVIALLGGIWVIRRPAAAGSALWPALLTGVMIAAYTSLDRIGVRLGSPWIYGWLLWLFGAVLLVAFTRIRRVPHSRLTDEPRLSLAGGTPQTAAYFMILFALSVAPLAIIPPLRDPPT